MKQVLALTTGLIFFTACAVGPNYKTPQTKMPAAWASPLMGGESTGSAELVDWWKNFGDPELNALMTQAEQSNLSVLMAEARVREARAQEAVAAGGFGPSLSGATSYTRNRWGHNSFPPLPPGTPINYNLYNLGFDAAWELDIFGGTRRTIEAAKAEMGAAIYGQRDVLISLLAEVARNYIAARAFQQRLDITRQNIEVEQKILDLTNNRFQNGLSSDLDVQQATALLKATQAQIPSLESGFQQSVYALGVLLGQQPGALLNELSKEERIPSLPPVVPVGLPSELLQRRPDIQRAERDLAAATARIGVAKADLFPKFSLTGMGVLKAFLPIRGSIMPVVMDRLARQCSGNYLNLDVSMRISKSKMPVKNKLWMRINKQYLSPCRMLTVLLRIMLRNRLSVRPCQNRCKRIKKR